MTIVSSLQGTRVQEFWKGFLPTEQAQDPILWYRTKSAWQPVSYKDLNARAHCVAAFFMARGMRKGDRVGIVSRQSLDYVVLDLALQYIGAVNLSLPYDCSLETVIRACDEYDFNFIYYSNIDTFLNHGQLESLKPRLHGILLSGDEVDELDPEKVVTFDRVVALGKVDWRESAPQLVDIKTAVTPEDVYSLEFDRKKGCFGRELNFSEMMDMITDAEELFREKGIRLLLSALGPDHLHQRLHGVFPALRLRTHVYLLPAESLTREDFTGLRPQALLTDPKGASRLFQALPAYLGGGPAVEKTFAKARAVLARRDDAQAQGKKDPLMNRLRYRSGNRKLYRRIHGQLGGRLGTLLCEKGAMEAEAARLFRECRIDIVIQ